MMWPFIELEAERMRRFQECINVMKVQAANHKPMLRHEDIIHIQARDK